MTIGMIVLFKFSSKLKGIMSKATDPRQYDSPEMNWEILGADGERKYFRDELEKFIEPGSLVGKRALDIGSGVGHLFPWLKEKGVTAVTGIDPATTNVATSSEKYPWANSVVAMLEDFAKNSSETFDVALCVLAFEHIENLEAAFQDVINLLEPGGKFYLVITDKDYSLSNDKALRGEGFVSVEVLREIGNDAVEAKTTRDLVGGKQSVMYDIFRPIERVRVAARASGFKLFSEKTLNTPPPASVPMLYILGLEK